MSPCSLALVFIAIATTVHVLSMIMLSFSDIRQQTQTIRSVRTSTTFVEYRHEDNIRIP